jgi:hypothetical protein
MDRALGAPEACGIKAALSPTVMGSVLSKRLDPPLAALAERGMKA